MRIFSFIQEEMHNATMWYVVFDKMEGRRAVVWPAYSAYHVKYDSSGTSMEFGRYEKF